MPTNELAPVAPELFVSDVDASIRFYTEDLGFTLLRADADADGRRNFAVVTLGAATFLLAHHRFYGPHRRGETASQRGYAIDIRVMVDDVDSTYAAVRRRNVSVVHEIAERDYGLRDFIVRDPDGFRIRFAAPVAGPPR